MHAGPAQWGAQNLPDAVFKKFFWGRGGPFGILARGPTATLLRHCTITLTYTTLDSCIAYTYTTALFGCCWCTVDGLVDDNAEVGAAGGVVNSIRVEFAVVDSFNANDPTTFVLGPQWSHHYLCTSSNFN